MQESPRKLTLGVIPTTCIAPTSSFGTTFIGAESNLAMMAFSCFSRALDGGVH